MISVRLSIRLVYSCIFHPCDLLPIFPLPHFQSPRSVYSERCKEKATDDVKRVTLGVLWVLQPYLLQFLRVVGSVMILTYAIREMWYVQQQY